MTFKKDIHLIDIPLDLGANKHGSSLGPQAIRQAGLEEKINLLNLNIINEQDFMIPNRQSVNVSKQNKAYQAEILRTCNALKQKTYQSLQQGGLPIILGGDHSLALGSIAGIKQWHHEQARTLGVIWFDAHADLNTHTTSISQNIHGMPLAALLGEGTPELTKINSSSFLEDHDIALVGIRELDPPEVQFIARRKLRHYPMTSITTHGVEAVMTELIEHFVKKFDAIHISFDIDGIDPHYAPGVSTPVPNGLSFQEARKALKMLAKTAKLVSMDVVELNPIYDIENKTALLATQLIQSALGS